jgi:hypothetical protein
MPGRGEGAHETTSSNMYYGMYLAVAILILVYNAPRKFTGNRIVADAS